MNDVVEKLAQVSIGALSLAVSREAAPVGVGGQLPSNWGDREVLSSDIDWDAGL